MNKTDIINILFTKCKLNTYLQIGVDSADTTFNDVISEAKHGVVTMRMQDNGIIYDPGSIEFFKNCPLEQKYDVIFIQSIYEFDEVYQDVKNAMLHLSDNGFIVVHGCNPLEEKWTVPIEQYSSGPWIGSAFRAFIRLKYEHKDWSFFTIEDDFGCGIITKLPILKNRCMLLGSLTWPVFENNKNDLLQLVTYEEFQSLLNES